MITATKEGRSHGGFSLIEVIVVIALIAFVYTVAIPQFNLRTGAEVSTKLSQLAGDIRNAYDMAVLTGKAYRIVFNFNSGEYWLEETDRSDFQLPADKIDRELSESEQKDEEVAFDSRFQQFTELAGPSVADPKGDKEIPPTSPLLTAKSSLRLPSWGRVDGADWSGRTIGPNLMIKDMQCEHHGHKLDLNELGQDAHAMLYFFPRGYVERAVIHVAYKKSDMVPDESQEMYTITTNPFEGTAEVQPGYRDVDVSQEKEE
ncbi:MAG: type II secretion system protein [Deltaproteobacteria bacterium]|nr:type II secretion system protein [Deltaproteobacteria bacterium]